MIYVASRYLKLVEGVASAIDFAEKKGLFFTDEEGEINKELYQFLGGYYEDAIMEVIGRMVAFGDIKIIPDDKTKKCYIKEMVR